MKPWVPMLIRMEIFFSHPPPPPAQRKRAVSKRKKDFVSNLIVSRATNFYFIE